MNRIKKLLIIGIVLTGVVCLGGCEKEVVEEEVVELQPLELLSDQEKEEIAKKEAEAEAAAKAAEEAAIAEREAAERAEKASQFIIAIDPGHQGKGNYNKEPIGPGASETKAKVASGTAGVATGVPEYELTLEVSLKLRDMLEEKGYQVIMIRESNDVDISNAERAAVANDAGADVFLRIHANGSTNSSTQGAMTICPTPNNPYCSGIYAQSAQLSTLVLDNLVSSTGCKKERVWETDTMSGINWCKVPVTIVEMGYMSNPDEDQRMQTDEYQQKIIEGITNGVEAYIATQI